MSGELDWPSYGITNEGMTPAANSIVIGVENKAGSGKIVKVSYFDLSTSHAAAYAGAIMGLQFKRGVYGSGGSNRPIRAHDSNYAAPSTTLVEGRSGAATITSTIILASLTFSSASIEHANGIASANYWHRNLLPVRPGGGHIVRPGEFWVAQTMLEDTGAFIRANVEIQIGDEETTALIDRFDTLNERQAEIRDNLATLSDTVNLLTLNEQTVYVPVEDDRIVEIRTMGGLG